MSFQIKKKRIALIWKVLIACALGGMSGGLLPVPVIRIFTTFNYIFSQYIGFMIPLIIVGLVTPAICRMGSNAGKMLLFTLVLAYLSSVAAGLFSYAVCDGFFPKLLGGIMAGAASAGTDTVTPFFTLDIPAIMSVTSALVLAFLVGTLLASTGKGHLMNVAFDFEEIVAKAISKTLIPLLPLFIFGVFLKMAHTGDMVPVMKVFAKIIAVIFAMTVTWLIALFGIAGLISRRNPFKCLGKMFPAYLTALGTASSAATIPVTLQCARKCGISEPVSNFSVPLCATIHMPGSLMEIASCAIAIMLLDGIPLSFGLMLQFIMLLAITAVAAPGVPGGMMMASLGLLTSVLGFNEGNLSLMITLFVIIDSFGTACNVVSDGAIALIVEKFFPSRCGH